MTVTAARPDVSGIVDLVPENAHFICGQRDAVRPGRVRLDERRASRGRLARGLQAGQVYVNTYGPAGVIGAPFGGYKKSGFGRTMGADTILEYTQVKAVVINAND